jgi:hypothetical protein
MWLQFLPVNQAWVVTMSGLILKGPCSRVECERWAAETKAEVDLAYARHMSADGDGEDEAREAATLESLDDEV